MIDHRNNIMIAVEFTDIIMTFVTKNPFSVDFYGATNRRINN